MKTVLVFLFSATFACSTHAADYDFLDPGDVFFINDFGSENRRVEVVRKLGGQQVKVRNLATGEASTVSASRLLTEKELRREEFQNKAGGVAIGVAVAVCLFSPDTCKSKNQSD